MVARITTAAFQGIDVQAVNAQQAHMASSLPAFTIVGLIKLTFKPSRRGF